MIRGRWPDILEGIRAHSRVTWTMVSSDNAHVVGVEGRTVQIGFNIPRLRESFSGSKHEDLLRQVLGQILGGDWRVEVIVDPSAGHGGGSASGQGPYPPQPGPGQGGQGGQGGQSGGWGAPTPPQAPPSAPAASPAETSAPPSAAPDAPSAYAGGPGSPGQSPSAYAPGLGPLPGGPAATPGPGTGPGTPMQSANAQTQAHAQHAGVAAPRPQPPAQAPPGPPPPGVPPPPEDDFDPHVAAFDDEAAPAEPGLSARDLLIKELGASVLEEIQNPD